MSSVTPAAMDMIICERKSMRGAMEVSTCSRSHGFTASSTMSVPRVASTLSVDTVIPGACEASSPSFVADGSVTIIFPAANFPLLARPTAIAPPMLPPPMIPIFIMD